jgi:hypothetical protein
VLPGAWLVNGRKCVCVCVGSGGGGGGKTAGPQASLRCSSKRQRSADALLPRSWGEGGVLNSWITRTVVQDNVEEHTAGVGKSACVRSGGDGSWTKLTPPPQPPPGCIAVSVWCSFTTQVEEGEARPTIKSRCRPHP